MVDTSSDSLKFAGVASAHWRAQHLLTIVREAGWLGWSCVFLFFLRFLFIIWIIQCSDFIMASKEKASGKRKRVNLTLAQKLELIKKVESVFFCRPLVWRIRSKTKKTVSDIRKSKDKLKEYAPFKDLSAVFLWGLATSNHYRLTKHC